MRSRRDLVARSWTYPRRRSAYKALDDEVVEGVLRLARENPRWGYLCIVGECRKLGVAVSATSVRNVPRRHRLRPAPRTSGPSWSAFLRAQAAGTLACDFFHVDTVMLRRTYVLFFINLDRRKVFLAGVTGHPVGPWVTQQARNLVATLEDQGRAVRFLVRDRDDKFVWSFDEVLRSTGARTIKTLRPGASGERVRRKICPHSTNRVPGLAAHPQRTPPRPRPPRVRPALQLRAPAPRDRPPGTGPPFERAPLQRRGRHKAS